MDTERIGSLQHSGLYTANGPALQVRGYVS